MTSETNSQDERVQRVVFTPLKPKRRCKISEPASPQPKKPIEKPHSPVLLNARAEFRRQHPRIPRSGRPQVHFHRVTPPSELMELMPKNSQSPVLARVIDRIKTHRPRHGGHHGFWGLLRYWMFAFR
ncbi:MAG TPA: hypothetical protein VJ719_06870 [Chthoniobacterales bacterium]|nr:hypothetical protein [Chthoniobacterales bacterium]